MAHFAAGGAFHIGGHHHLFSDDAEVEFVGA